MTSRTIIPALTGLRGAAALLVFVGHYLEQTTFIEMSLAGTLAREGVMIFFALSGFLMAFIYAPQRATRAALWAFFVRRAARVVPLFCLTVVLCFLSNIVLHTSPYDINAGNIANNLLFIQGESVLWSIPVEVQFYVLFSLIWLAGLLSSRISAFLVLILSIIITIVFQANTLLLAFPFFFIGVAAYFVDEKYGRVALPLAVVTFILSLSQVTSALHLPPADAYLSVQRMVSAGALLVWARSAHAAWLGSALLQVFGEISYAFYVLHWPVMWAFIVFSPITNTTNPLAYLVLTFSVTAVAAWVVNATVARPAQAFLLRLAKLGTPTLSARAS